MSAELIYGLNRAAVHLGVSPRHLVRVLVREGVIAARRKGGAEPDHVRVAAARYLRRRARVIGSGDFVAAELEDIADHLCPEPEAVS